MKLLAHSLFAILVAALAALAALLVVPAHAFSLERDIPQQARQYLPVVSAQVHELWPDTPEVAYIPALIEHESGCPSLPRMCWAPTARLKTQREEGAGFGQLTRAYRQDGALRFDALAESRKLDPRGLNELRWDSVYQRPDLQIRVAVLMVRQSWNRLTPLVDDSGVRLHLTDVAYNAGVGRAMNDMRACGLQKGCNPQKWIGNVATVCTASRKPIYGARSACDIYHYHVEDVFKRIPKYRGWV